MSKMCHYFYVNFVHLESPVTTFLSTLPQKARGRCVEVSGGNSSSNATISIDNTVCCSPHMFKSEVRLRFMVSL